MELTKTSQLDELIEFIKGKKDSRELKRALAVKERSRRICLS